MLTLNKSRTLHVLVFISIFFFSFASYALAYNNYDNWSCKWSNPSNVKYKFIASTPTDYRNIFATAVVNFNNTATKVGLSLDYTSTTANTFGIFNEDSNTMGRTVYTCKFPTYSEISTSDAGLNNLYFYNNPYRKAELQIKVAHHEIGHFMALGHSSVSPAVMQEGLKYYQKPQQDDVNGLNSLYP